MQLSGATTRDLTPESSGENSATRFQDAVSPASGEVLGRFALSRPADVDRAVRAARSAYPGWAALSVHERSAQLEEIIRVVDARRDLLGELLALEQGKPLQSEALPEIDELVSNLRLAIELGKHLEGSMPQLRDAGKRALVYRVPRGVVAAIQPWNYPLGTLSAQVAPALITGNTVVSLAAPSTTLTAMMFAECVIEAGLPAGVFGLVTGYGSEIGDSLTGHPLVDAVTFAGSVATGERIARSAAGKAQLIELGGNGPVVVLDDADLDIVIPDAIASTFYCAGQSCVAAGRFLVHADIYDEFAARLVQAVAEQVRLGDPRQESTTMGPLNNSALAAKIDRHVMDAVAAGATVLTGGHRATGFPTELYWEPTVLGEVTEQMSVATEETFGPIAPLQRIFSDDEALAIIDASPYGLSSAVYTRDVGRGIRFAERASSGMVGVNAPTDSGEPNLPFGGRSGKSSGIGRSQGRYPMEEFFTELKTVLVRL